MKESDWKVFKEIKEKAIEQFCNKALEEFKGVIEERRGKSQEAYTLLYRSVQDKDKRMALIFDGHSRSKAELQLLAIRSEGLADEKLLSNLSNEFLEQTDPKRINW